MIAGIISSVVKLRTIKQQMRTDVGKMFATLVKLLKYNLAKHTKSFKIIGSIERNQRLIINKYWQDMNKSSSKYPSIDLFLLVWKVTTNSVGNIHGLVQEISQIVCSVAGRSRTSHE